LLNLARVAAGDFDELLSDGEVAHDGSVMDLRAAISASACITDDFAIPDIDGFCTSGDAQNPCIAAIANLSRLVSVPSNVRRSNVPSWNNGLSGIMAQK
jgi:hypothetical protein